MRKRDMEILSNLQRFRCLTRDQIIQLHFPNLKNPVTSCNAVLKRMRRDGHIEVNTSQQPYIYFPSPLPIKKDSSKIPHFLAIADFYISLLRYQPSNQFIVEPKYGKGFMEPDIFMIWRRAPFFVEIQRSVYSKNVMNAKFERYQEYYDSGQWQNEPWQPSNTKVFPRVLLITDTRYELPTHSPIKFFQAQNLEQFTAITTTGNVQKQADPIKITAGNLRITRAQ